MHTCDVAYALSFLEELGGHWVTMTSIGNPPNTALSFPKSNLWLTLILQTGVSETSPFMLTLASMLINSGMKRNLFPQTIQALYRKGCR